MITIREYLNEEHKFCFDLIPGEVNIEREMNYDYDKKEYADVVPGGRFNIYLLQTGMVYQFDYNKALKLFRNVIDSSEKVAIRIIKQRFHI